MRHTSAIAKLSVLFVLLVLEPAISKTTAEHGSAASKKQTHLQQQQHSLGTTLRGCEHFFGYTWTYYSPSDGMEYCCQTHMVSYDFDYAHLDHILHGEEDKEHFQPCCCPRYSGCSLSLEENKCRCSCSPTKPKTIPETSHTASSRHVIAPTVAPSNSNTHNNLGKNEPDHHKQENQTSNTTLSDPAVPNYDGDLMEPSLILEIFVLSILLRIVYWCFWLQEQSERHWRLLQAYQYARRNERLALLNHQWSVTSLRQAYNSIDEEQSDALAMCDTTAAAA